MAFNSTGLRSRRGKELKKAQRLRLEAALEEGLKGTFPASDSQHPSEASFKMKHLSRY
jgi:hypothetical protein